MKKPSNEIPKSNIYKPSTTSDCTYFQLSNDELITMVKAIYDEELISHINKLSSNIKSFYIEHQSIFTMVNNNLKQSSYSNLNDSIKKLDKCFEDFYGNAKIIFKDMKDDRNSKNEKMDLIQKQNPNLKHFINENIFLLKKGKKLEINKSEQYNHRSSSKTQSREISAYVTQTGSANIKHKNHHSNINTSAGDVNANKTLNQQSDINKIKHFNMKRENTLLKQKIEILEKKANNVNNNNHSNLSPKSPKKMKLDFVYPKPNDNNPVITQTNKATTNYMQIVNNVNNTINNIDPVVQQENNKIKDKMCILANKVNKLISDMKHAERNIHNETELISLKLQIEKDKESILKMTFPYINTNTIELAEQKSKEGSYSQDKNLTNSAKSIKTDPKKIDPKVLKETINNLKTQNQKLTKKLQNFEKINEQLKYEINNLKLVNIHKDDYKDDKNNEQIFKLIEDMSDSGCKIIVFTGGEAHENRIDP